MKIKWIEFNARSNGQELERIICKFHYRLIIIVLAFNIWTICLLPGSVAYCAQKISNTNKSIVWIYFARKKIIKSVDAELVAGLISSFVFHAFLPRTHWCICTQCGYCCCCCYVAYIKRYQSPDFRMKITPLENASVLSSTWNHFIRRHAIWFHPLITHRCHWLHDSWNVYTRFDKISSNICNIIMRLARACVRVCTSNHKWGKYVYIVMNWWRRRRRHRRRHQHGQTIFRAHQ